MSARKQPPHRYKLCLNSHGKTYWADYYIENGSVTVKAVSKDGTIVQKSTHIGASAELTTRMLLKELISAGQVQESGC
jgi:hypothetical protein